MLKEIDNPVLYEFCVDYIDGSSLIWECTEEEIFDLAERTSHKRGYKIYKIKVIKELIKEKN